MYIGIELVKKTTMDEFGVNYPENKTIIGIFTGVIEEHNQKFVLVRHGASSITGYNVAHYAIMYVELYHSTATFTHEDKANPQNNLYRRRYMFVTGTSEDQAAAIKELDRLVNCIASGPVLNLCPGCVDAQSHFSDAPSRWRGIKSANILPLHKDTVAGSPAAHTTYGFNTYTPPKKVSGVITRAAKVNPNTIAAMRAKVAELNKELLEAELEIEIADVNPSGNRAAADDDDADIRCKYLGWDY